MIIKTSKRYKKDLNKLILQLGKNRATSIISPVLEMLLRKDDLPTKYKDHPLFGDYAGYRDCHITSDLILIYKYLDNGESLYLLRLSSHSELF